MHKPVLFVHAMLALVQGSDVMNLQERVRAAAGMLAAALPRSNTQPVACTCAGYCTGQCFAAGCGSCPAGTWSFPGGKSLCVDPGPLGVGILCEIDEQTGNVTRHACCHMNSTRCTLPEGECCSTGDCSTCPPYPPAPSPLFPPLQDRTWDAQHNACRENITLRVDGNLI